MSELNLDRQKNIRMREATYQKALKLAKKAKLKPPAWFRMAVEKYIEHQKCPHCGEDLS